MGLQVVRAAAVKRLVGYVQGQGVLKRVGDVVGEEAERGELAAPFDGAHVDARPLLTRLLVLTLLLRESAAGGQEEEEESGRGLSDLHCYRRYLIPLNAVLSEYSTHFIWSLYSRDMPRTACPHVRMQTYALCAMRTCGRMR